MEVAWDGLVLYQFGLAQQLDHVGTKAPLVRKGVDFHGAVENCRSGGVLKAEFAVKAIHRLRPVDILHERRLYAHAGDLGTNPDLAVEFKPGADRKMGSILRWEQLDRQPRIHDAKRAAIGGQLLLIESIRIVGSEQTFRRFDHIVRH